MPRNPNIPHKHDCGPIHTPTSTSENIKLQVLASKLEAQLRDEFVSKENLKTINLESLLGEGNINIRNISKIEKTSSEGLVDTYTIYFNDNSEPFSFIITNGAKGEKGDQGIPGEKGDKGDQGEKGDKGEPGEKGETGAQGPQGIPGEKGKDGVDGKDFTYDMFTEEQLEALRGPQGEVGPQGPQGEQGPVGEKGKDGLTTAIKVGEITYTHTDGLIELPTFLTEHQNLDNYYTKIEVDNLLPDVSKFITEIPEEYITDSELSSKGFITDSDLSNYAKREELFSGSYNDLSDKPTIPSIEGLATEEFVKTELSKVEFPTTDLTNYYTKEEVDAKFDNVEHPTIDLSEYATKEEVKTLDNSIGFIPLDDRTMCQVIDDTYATKESVEEAINNISIPDVDLSNVATKDDLNALHSSIGYAAIDDKTFAEVIDATFAKKEEIPVVDNFVTNNDLENKGYLTEHQNLDHKANNILSATDKFVTKEFGSFKVGDSIKGLTLEEIFAKLLGLSDTKPEENPENPDVPEIPGENATPKEIVDYLMNTKTTMYSQDTTGNLVETPFAANNWTEEEAAVKMDGVSTLYHIEDKNGNIIESGYQEATDYNEEAWLTVALPSQIKGVKVKMYDPDVNDWVEMNWKVVPADNQTMEGYTIWTVPEDYEVMSGDTYRFVIID